MSDNITILEKYFNPLYFSVNEPQPDSLIVYSLENPNGSPCLELKIQGNYMKIEYIGKCNYRITGSQILNIIQKFVNDKRTINIVELQDTSRIPNLCNRYDIPLYIIYILSTGKSWYNSYGYKSADYTNELRHNAKLMNMNIYDFIMICNRKNTYNPMDENELHEMIDVFINVMNEHQYYKINKKRSKFHSQMTVKETFTRIKNYILKNMPEIKEVDFESNEYCYALKWIMDLIHNSSIIRYDQSVMIWTVSNSFSGRKSSYKIPSSVRRRNTTSYKKTHVSRINTLKRRSI